MKNNMQFYKGIVAGIVVCLFLYMGTIWYNAAFSGNNTDSANINRKVNEIINLLDTYYVDGVDVDELKEGVYEGVVYNVGDKYTAYFSRENYNTFIESMSGTYAGIGVYVYASDDNMITVSGTISGSPGEGAGIIADDKIVKVNGTPVTGDNLDDAVNMLKGRAGTEVTITILRENTDETFDIKVQREKIDIPTIEYKIIEDGIGYIGISAFDNNTAEQFKQALATLNEQGKEALIIDVRNNLGGYLNRVVEICDMLLPKANIVYTEDKNGNRKHTDSSESQLFDGPIVVLINSASASASEILAGALKDNDAAVLVGETTFGKGLVQQFFKLSDDSAVKVTVEKYYTPSGASINGVGISPDYEVVINGDEKGKVDIVDEDDDIQMEKAIEVLREKLTVR